jgi:hypothetical protein
LALVANPAQIPARTAKPLFKCNTSVSAASA